jgi:hypothetical protein
MINLLQNLDSSFSSQFPSYNNFNSLLLTNNDNSSFLPLDENINNKKSKNIFITKKTMKEKIEHQKIKLGKEKETKEIYLNKKEDLKRRNREAAQNSRNKKKLEFIKLLEENKMLKDKIFLINSKINLLCSHCKNFFESNQPINTNNICLNCSFNDNNNKNNDEDIIFDENIFDSHNTQTTFFNNLKIQKMFNFVLISLFSLFCLFCFFSNGLSYINNNNIRKTQEIINSTNNFNNSMIKENVIKNIEDKFYENEFFNSFQCKKRSFKSIMLNEIDEFEKIKYINYNNISKEKNESKIKNPIYFKLFVQSCSLDEEPENNINKDYNIINENKHYIFSTDKTTYQDFYFFCQKTDN